MKRQRQPGRTRCHGVQTKVDISCCARKMLSTCSWCRLVASWHHWWHRGGTTGGTCRGIKMSDLVYLRRSRRPSISIGTGHKWLSRNLNGWPELFHALLCQPLHVLSDPVADSTTNRPRFANTEVAICLESFFYSDSVCSLNLLIGYVK